MLDTYTQAVKILHLDHPLDDWIRAGYISLPRLAADEVEQRRAAKFMREKDASFDEARVRRQHVAAKRRLQIGGAGPDA